MAHDTHRPTGSRSSMRADSTIAFSGWPQLKAVRNALRTGHCAPTVMRTLRELQGADYASMVRMVSAMGGGIGMLRNECGAATSPILFLGLLYDEQTGPDGIPKVITLGQRYLKRFAGLHGGVRCREVTPAFKNVFPCLQAMRHAPKILCDVIREDIGQDAPVPGGAALLQAFEQQNFHCALSVLSELADGIALDPLHLRAARGLIGGTVLQGMTCSALSAGMLAIGIHCGQIENSYLRVPRLLFRIASGLDFMHERYNAFNSAMNIGNSLGLWFNNEFGATECKDVLGKDLSTQDGVDGYIAENTIERCREISAGVAARVRDMLHTIP
jgi:C_GCAxxG_C_C family probable redox protein